MMPANQTQPVLGAEQHCCFDNQYRPTFHGAEQRYISPTTGRCKQLVVQAVQPQHRNFERTEILLSADTPARTKLAVWLMSHDFSHPNWLPYWIWFMLTLAWPQFCPPKHTGLYPAYLSGYKGHLWISRSPREYSLRAERLGEEPVREITHSPYPRRLIIYDPALESWNICSESDIIKQQRYVAISYRYDDIIPEGADETTRLSLQEAFITNVEAILTSLGETAYWVDLTLVDKTSSPAEINKDLYRMADVYRSAQFTLIMLNPPVEVTEDEAWKGYGERLWTLPEALLSRELRYKFRDHEVIPITLRQLANRAYAQLDEESSIINSYAGRDPLERLERLTMLKSAIWRRTSRTLERLGENKEAERLFGAERVYALMGFFQHRIHPHSQETELQALVRLSMANDSDRLVERMVSLLSSQIPGTASWYAERDEWGANLWDIEADIQVVGMTENHALVLGGCRAAAIRWRNFPSVGFATRRSFTRLIAMHAPHILWEVVVIAILLGVIRQFSTPSDYTDGYTDGSTTCQYNGYTNGSMTCQYNGYTDGSTTGQYNGYTVGLGFTVTIAATLAAFAPRLVAYGTSGRIVNAQPWLVGVKGLISAEEASELMYGGAISSVPRTSYSPSGTLLAQTDKGKFRRGDPVQLKTLQDNMDPRRDDDLYSLVDTHSAMVYYFRAERPPTVCLFTGRESGMGRFVLCSERCTVNELHKETVIRMPWHVSQSMPACDWVALN